MEEAHAIAQREVASLNRQLSDANVARNRLASDLEALEGDLDDMKAHLEQRNSVVKYPNIHYNSRRINVLPLCIRTGNTNFVSGAADIV